MRLIQFVSNVLDEFSVYFPMLCLCSASKLFLKQYTFSYLMLSVGVS